MIALTYPAIGLPGGMEWFWIFLIFLVLFGAAALPKLFRSLGKSVREFKKAQEGFYDEMDKADGSGGRASGKDDKGAEGAPGAGAQSAEGKKKPAAKPSDSGPSSTTDA
jgi:sec-independent protein translocase protein TatA